MPKDISERKLVLLLGAVQFINILDFMMVMPLGPDFASALRIPMDHLGIVAGSYTASAAVAGIIGTLFLDRFDRRLALFVAMLGLVTGTLAGGFATGMSSMLATRILAGAFGGPATALSLSILTDKIPPARRGKALGAVMGSFAIASVIGVPAGLALSHLGSWRTPFFAVAGMGLLLVTAVIAMMPPMKGHLEARGTQQPVRPIGAFLSDPTVLLSLAAMGVTMMGTFALIVNLSAFVQFNLGYPRARLDVLYMVGGAVSFFTMRIAGKMIDRTGSMKVTVAGTILMITVIALVFLPARPWIPAVGMFVGFMMANSTRIVALNTLTMRVPSHNERARFMSAQSAVQHISTAAGAGISAVFLHERADHSLSGMPTLAVGSIVLSASLPFLVGAVTKRLQARPNVAMPAGPGLTAAAGPVPPQVAGSPSGAPT